MQEKPADIGFGTLALAALFLLVLPLLASLAAAQVEGWVGALGVGSLIFLSTATVGALLGFIFAVPRVVARGTAGAGGNTGWTKLLDTNTNLERISDWLTTMLVGVGLSQLTNLNDALLAFRLFLADAAQVYQPAGSAAHAGVLPAVGPFILVLGAATGFIFMYLLTRFVLIDYFIKSEEKTLSPLAVAAVQVAITDTEAPATAPADDKAVPGKRKGVSAAGQPAQEAAPPRAAPASAAPSATLRYASQAATLSTEEVLAVMFELLYKPGGYQRVIQMSGELSRSPVARHAEYWFYLAAAYGQQMHRTKKDSAEYQAARRSALNAAKEAVRLDKSFRSRLWQISDPDSIDYDLSLLREDPEFLQLVRKSA